MKVLILAAGRGSRVEAYSENSNKCMLKFAGKPLIQYSLDNAITIEPDEIIITVGYQAEQIINEFGTTYKGFRIKYVIQKDQMGLVHALETAAHFLGNSDFMLLLADEIFLCPRHVEMMRLYQSENIFSVCGITKPDNADQIRKTYAIIQNDEYQIYRLIEKPRRPINEYQGTGNIIFRNEILNYIDYTPINQSRKEKELPDLIQCAIDDGHIVRSFYIGQDYININTIDDINLAEKNIGAMS